MARNFSPQKRRNKYVLSPHQRIISSYFTPKSGISKEEVNFLVKPKKDLKNKTRFPTPTESRETGDAISDQFAFPVEISGFTTATNVHKQAVKLVGSDPKHTSTSSLRWSGLGSEGWQSHVTEDSSGKDSVYCSRDTHGSLSHMAPMAPSSSPKSARKRKRRNQPLKRPSGRKIKLQKRHKHNTSHKDDCDMDENGGISSDSDCCIVNVVQHKHDPENGNSSDSETSSLKASRKKQSVSSSLASTSKCSDSEKSSHKAKNKKAKVSPCAKSTSSSNKSSDEARMKKPRPSKKSVLKSTPCGSKRSELSHNKSRKTKPSASSFVKRSSSESKSSELARKSSKKKQSLSLPAKSTPSCSSSESSESSDDDSPEKPSVTSVAKATSSSGKSSKLSQKSSKKKESESLPANASPTSSESSESSDDDSLEKPSVTAVSKSISNSSKSNKLSHKSSKKEGIESLHVNTSPSNSEGSESPHEADKKLASSSSESSDSSRKAGKKKPRKRKKMSSARSSMYGLVKGDESDTEDDSDDSTPPVKEFSHLPEEIMENIFCQLPVIDLMLNCVLVCQQWNRIITRYSFIPWKKKYFRLKKKDPECEDEMTELLDQEGLLELELFPTNLASFMKTFKRKCHQSLTENLKTHSKFQLIKTFLETLAENSKTKHPSPWSIVALLTLVCQTVYEVQEIVRCLTRSTSCLVQDILECFYCLASIFYHLGSQNRIGSGLHYRVFYTLYLYENAFQATCASINAVFDQNFSGQQSIMKYRSLNDKLQLTHEQVRIIKHDLQNGEIIKIMAFAGTGKTTTLVEYTKMRPMEKFLNVAYNKSIQEQAVTLFPQNVESRTIHSLAYKGVGFRYRHKLAYGMRISTILNALPEKSGFLYARRVEDTLKNFIASADNTVEAKHVPPVRFNPFDVLPTDGGYNSDDNRDANFEYLNSDSCVKKVVSHAAGLWERMKDTSDKEFPITHDGYLKIYQLSRPVLNSFDCLVIDEAQDCTPAAADILLNQRCAKILVGDPHQQIYSFRGAVNTLQQVQSTHTFYLTQSFRFGPEIAHVASCVLDVLKGIRDKTLVGGARKGSVHGKTRGQVCVITRCNYTLFNEAVNVCCANNDTKVGFVGGIKSLALDRISDIHKLFVSGSNKGFLGIKDMLIRKFASFAELKKYAKAAPDPELLGKIRIVETHHVMLERRIEKIKSKVVGNQQHADIIFSTAHKAKGLEFDTVRVTDDFLPGSDTGHIPLDRQPDDEKNLLYVAVSRAKKCLQLNGTILRLLACRMEYFVKAMPPTDLPQSAVCIDCGVEIDVSLSPHIAVLKETITLGGNVRVPGGPLCSSCAMAKAPHLGCLGEA
ncbi:F-box DNA helicase 1-like [Montipora foliosa]|uniref:F-box DNA helicase 1-like n=1 Tax=Montipora foliosa TaxID=591990 RepID=UPI0035F13F09